MLCNHRKQRVCRASILSVIYIHPQSDISQVAITLDYCYLPHCHALHKTRYQILGASGVIGQQYETVCQLLSNVRPFLYQKIRQLPAIVLTSHTGYDNAATSAMTTSTARTAI